MKRLLQFGICLCLTVSAITAIAAGPGRRHSRVETAVFDNTTFFDANDLLMFVTNSGAFATDKTGLFGNEYGLYYPRGTNKSVLFSGGVWLGAKVDGVVRVSAADFGEDFVPGPMSDGLALANRGSYRVYKIRSGDTPESNPAYRDWPFADGAPALRNRAGNDSLDASGDRIPLLLGDQALWSVFNDGNPARRGSFAGTGTAQPLGVEVQSYVWGYSRAGALGQTLFMRLTITNKGANNLEEMYISLWADPDVGDYSDDLVGSDINRSLGYAYNDGPDGVYGSAPPAVGFDFFQGPIVPAGVDDSAWISSRSEWVKGSVNLPMTSFNKYVNGTDPLVNVEAYNYMQGLDKAGNVQVDPTTDEISAYVMNGDPVSGNGWIDNNADDRRFMMSSGPFTMAPGESQEIVVAICVGQGTDHLSSIDALRQVDDIAQSVFDANFAIPGPPPQPSLWAIPHDGAVQLLWGTEADDDVQHGLGPPDPLTAEQQIIEQYVMEGFNLYQGVSAAGPWTKIVTYDVVNTIERIYGDVDSPQGKERVVVQRGTNSGLVHELLVAEDRLNGGTLVNNKPYYFAVTAYNYDEMNSPDFEIGGNAFGVVSESFENLPSVGAVAVTPRSVAGVLADTAAHIAGVSGGTVLVDFFNQDAITGATYQVSFNDDGSWNLTNASANPPEVVLENEAMMIASRSVDGMVVRVLGPSAGVSAVQEVSGSEGSIDAVNVNFNINSTGDWYMDPGGNHSLEDYTWAAATLHDYEIRFTDNSDAYCWDWWGFEDTYSNVWQSESGTLIGVPLEIWDITDNRRVTFMLIDKDASGDYSWGDKLYVRDIAYDDVDWQSAGIHSGMYVDDFTDLHYGRFTFYDYSGNLSRPAAGTIVRISTHKPNQPDDLFEFTTSPPGTSEGTLIARSLGAVHPVPNPSYNSARPVKFVNLPAGTATVRIFSLAGDLVRTLVKDDPGSAELVWDKLTEYGLPIASGLYIYHVQADGIGTKVGKIAVFIEEERLADY